MSDDLFGGPKTSDIGDEQKLEELEREFKYRRRVYGRLIAKGRLGPPVARERCLILKAIIEDYKEKIRAKENNRVQLAP